MLKAWHSKAGHRRNLDHTINYRGTRDGIREMAYERWNADNAALLLIDHQVGTIGWMHSTKKSDVKRYTLALAKAAIE